jgi:hypothetical protein
MQKVYRMTTSIYPISKIKTRLPTEINYRGMTDVYSGVAWKEDKKHIAGRESIKVLHRDFTINDPQFRAKLPTKKASNYIGLKDVRSPNDLDCHTSLSKEYVGVNSSSSKAKLVPPYPVARGHF